MCDNVFDKDDLEKLLKLVNTLAENIDRENLSDKDNWLLDIIQGIVLNHLDVLNGVYPLKNWNDCRWYMSEIENILENEGIKIL